MAVTTNAIVKLVWGARTLDLNAGRYETGADFIPPAAAILPQLSEGGSANRYGGASRQGEKALSRLLGFTVYISAASEQELHRALADINYFLRQGGDPAEPLYLHYPPPSHLDF